MSVNLELPTAKGLQELAPNKSRSTILTPMRQIQNGVEESRLALGMKGGNQSAYWYTQKRIGRALPGSQNGQIGSRLLHGTSGQEKEVTKEADIIQPSKATALTKWENRDISRGFVPSGQSTQMIIGASGESDYEIMAVTEALCGSLISKSILLCFCQCQSGCYTSGMEYSLRSDGNTGYIRLTFFLRYYGFQANELLSEKRPFFNTYLDPKCDWALGHLEEFPVEINSASFDTLLRVPGIGVKSARRIIKARKTGNLDFEALKAIGVVMKRAVYFITCQGKMMYSFLKIDEDYITRNLIDKEPDVMKGYGEKVTYRQLSFFSDSEMSG